MLPDNSWLVYEMTCVFIVIIIQQYKLYVTCDVQRATGFTLNKALNDKVTRLNLNNPRCFAFSALRLRRVNYIKSFGRSFRPTRLTLSAFTFKKVKMSSRTGSFFLLLLFIYNNTVTVLSYHHYTHGLFCLLYLFTSELCCHCTQKVQVQQFAVLQIVTKLKR